jgi:hypothetical protein
VYSNFERNRMIATLDMLEAGAVPYPMVMTSMEHKRIIDGVRAHLATLSDVERRVAKRKFRKMHRKITKGKPRGRKTRNLTIERMNEMLPDNRGNVRPTASAQDRRNIEVFSSFLARSQKQGD